MLEYIKRKLHKQWCTKEEEARLNDYIQEGKEYLERYDPAIDWDRDNFARSLLTSYVMYTEANALDDFQANYLPDILSLNTRGDQDADTEE